MNNYTSAIAFNALCLWEEVLENPEEYAGVDHYREQNGVCETRDRMIEFAEASEAIWNAANDYGFEGPYDFEFVPLFLKYCTNARALVDEDTLRILVRSTDYELVGQKLALVSKAQTAEAIALQALKAFVK